MFQLDYFSTCRKISNDLKLGLFRQFNDVSYKVLTYENNELKTGSNVKLEKVIKFIPKKFTKEDLTYWSTFGITEDELIKNEIYSLKKLWIGTEDNLLPINFTNLTFAYRFLNDGELEKKKIYSPFNKQYKWTSSISTKHIEGINRLNFTSSSLIITKSRKDRICLSKLHSDVVNTQNEASTSITRDMDKFFFKNYKKVFVLFDSDQTGVEQCKKLNERGYLYLNVPKNIYQETGCKDVSDLLSYYGVEKGYDIIKNEMIKKEI